jgi:hypothetical protein
MLSDQPTTSYKRPFASRRAVTRAGLAVLVTALLEILVGYLSVPFHGSLGGSAVLTGATGIAAVAIIVTTWLFRRGRTNSSLTMAGVLATAAACLLCAIAGPLWILHSPSASRWLAAILGFAALGTGAYMRMSRSPNLYGSSNQRAGLAVAAWGVFLLLLVSFAPSALGSKFSLSDASDVQRLVPSAHSLLAAANYACVQPQDYVRLPELGVAKDICGQPDYIEFDAVNSYAYLYSPSGRFHGADECFLRLDSHWWEIYTESQGVTCPVGFNTIGGG